jgi:hypothetical protein
MKILQSFSPTREYDLNLYWDFFKDLDDGNLFVKSMFDVCRDWKSGFPPQSGDVRERYFELKKRNIAVLPETTTRWTTPPVEWIELKKKLGLNI